MAKKVQLEIKVDNTDEVKKALMENLEKALLKCGAQAQRHAVDNITAQGAVDTGLLRNSITYALGGNSPDKKSYSGDNPSQYGKGSSIPSGSYRGTAPSDSAGEKTVYIGTNVEYAMYVEFGTPNGKNKMRARPYLKPAVEDHQQEYTKIIEDTMKNGN